MEELAVPEKQGNFRRPLAEELLQVHDFTFENANQEQLLDMADELGVNVDASTPPDLIRWKLRRLQYK